MASTLTRRSVHRLLLIAALAVLATLFVIARAASQETDSFEIDIVFTQESFEFIPAVGNDASFDAPLSRGDVISAQAAVYASDDAGGERAGTFYFMGVGTAEPQYYETASNHLYAQGYLELFDQGTIALTAVVNFNGPYLVTITGGTGRYASGGGQCIATPTEEGEHWQCEIH